MLEMIKIHKNYYLSFQFLDGNHFHRDSACYLTEVYVIENQKFAIFDCSPYSFLNWEIQWSHYIRSKVTVHECAETIQGRKLYEEIRYILLIKVAF